MFTRLEKLKILDNRYIILLFYWEKNKVSEKYMRPQALKNVKIKVTKANNVKKININIF